MRAMEIQRSQLRRYKNYQSNVEFHCLGLLRLSKKKTIFVVYIRDFSVERELISREQRTVI